MNSFPILYKRNKEHAFEVGDVIRHVASKNDLFFVDFCGGSGYKCFLFVDGEPDCDKSVAFIYEDEPLLMRIEL